jgi:hypothetical protein
MSANASLPQNPMTLPEGVVVADLPTYPEATAAVDRLVANDFPVANVSIVGADLRSVERVLGSMTYARAAVSGLISGLWFGFFLGVLMLIWSPRNGMTYLLAALLLGGGFGIISGVIGYAISRRTRNYTSTHAIIATHYRLLVPSAEAERARSILGTSAPEL